MLKWLFFTHKIVSSPWSNIVWITSGMQDQFKLDRLAPLMKHAHNLLIQDLLLTMVIISQPRRKLGNQKIKTRKLNLINFYPCQNGGKRSQLLLPKLYSVPRGLYPQDTRMIGKWSFIKILARPNPTWSKNIKKSSAYFFCLFNVPVLLLFCASVQPSFVTQCHCQPNTHPHCVHIEANIFGLYYTVCKAQTCFTRYSIFFFTHWTNWIWLCQKYK